jgi:hypothetical protein
MITPVSSENEPLRVSPLKLLLRQAVFSSPYTQLSPKFLGGHTHWVAGFSKKPGVLLIFT